MVEPMHSDWEDLVISSRELENLTGLDISETFMGRAYRPSLFRHPKRLFSFLVTEVLTLALTLILCLPAALVIARGVGNLAHDSSRVLPFLIAATGVAIVIFVLWNGWMWWQGKNLQTLAHLLDEVDQYNEIIQALHIIDELETVNPTALGVADRTEVVRALQATRESLVRALTTEKILRRHKRFMARRQKLFARIETNLATLQTL